MKKVKFIAVFVVVCNFSVTAKITKKEYVETWAFTAISQMKTHGIPASITLAQGILESGSGNSMLAQKANNHFGIKCHNWKGKKIYKDDDRKNECFRVYKNAAESYADHSDFLTRYSRYDFLFDLKKDDYKAWAKGLKKAGYATNPKYPSLLINIIEDLELYKYDQTENVNLHENEIAEITPVKEVKNEKTEKTIIFQTGNTHKVQRTEKREKYIITQKGDTYYRISKEFNLSLKQLYRYNGVKKKQDILKVGERVYISNPRKKGKLKNMFSKFKK